jgi:hypothetical protein
MSFLHIFQVNHQIYELFWELNTLPLLILHLAVMGIKHTLHIIDVALGYASGFCVDVMIVKYMFSQKNIK